MDEKSEMISRIQYLMAKDSKNKSQILRELHLSTSTLSDWEKGKGNPSSSAIIKLARYFNVTSDYLLFGTEKLEYRQLSQPENKWLQIYHLLSESEKQRLLDKMQVPSDLMEITTWLNYLSQLSKHERDICTAFIRGVLTEKNLKEC